MTELTAFSTSPRHCERSEAIQGRAGHDGAIYAQASELEDQGATDIRENQAQVDAQGNKVGTNRPDLQWTDVNGNRNALEWAAATTGFCKKNGIQCNDPACSVTTTRLKMSILEPFERIAFSVLPCPLASVRAAVMKQGEQWDKSFVIDEPTHRDVRLIYNSPDGPDRPPAINIGILLSEVDGVEGKKTLFVSSVADGYSSMLAGLSRAIPGTHLTFKVSRPDIRFPGCGIYAGRDGACIRAVYAMLDDNAWVFFEKGDPLPFEEVGLYRARRKRDRLSIDIVSSYIARCGYGSLCLGFWIDATAPAQLLGTRNFRVWNAGSA